MDMAFKKKKKDFGPPNIILNPLNNKNKNLNKKKIGLNNSKNNSKNKK